MLDEKSVKCCNYVRFAKTYQVAVVCAGLALVLVHVLCC